MNKMPLGRLIKAKEGESALQSILQSKVIKTEFGDEK
jgi:hypothetical protein